MPAGANRKREREYDELVRSFEREGRYPGREEQVAARIVNKQRREFGETRVAREKDRVGRSPDRGLPIPGYDELTVAQVLARARGLPPAALKRIRAYEERHRARKTLLARLRA